MLSARLYATRRARNHSNVGAHKLRIVTTTHVRVSEANIEDLASHSSNAFETAQNELLARCVCFHLAHSHYCKSKTALSNFRYLVLLSSEVGQFFYLAGQVTTTSSAIVMTAEVGNTDTLIKLR